jgi:pSer/pThr/pTyr-binding forkhead associated (FHA) protein
VDHNVIGRHPKNRIKILEAGISKVHCLIASEENQTFSIRDLGSRNGTYINGTRLKGKMFLKDGDEIKMGNTLCLFREQMEARRDQMASDDDKATPSAKYILHKVAPQQAE